MRDVEHEAIKRMMEEAERKGADSLLRTKPLEWIMCNEKLPDDGDIVIAATCTQLFLCYFDSAEGFICNGEQVSVGVWLPVSILPEMPNPEMERTDQHSFTCVYDCRRHNHDTSDSVIVQLCCVGREQVYGLDQ